MVSLMATIKDCVCQKLEASELRPGYVSVPAPPPVQPLFQPVPPVVDGSVPASLPPPAPVEDE